MGGTCISVQKAGNPQSKEDQHAFEPLFGCLLLGGLFVVRRAVFLSCGKKQKTRIRKRRKRRRRRRKTMTKKQEEWKRTKKRKEKRRKKKK